MDPKDIDEEPTASLTVSGSPWGMSIHKDGDGDGWQVSISPSDSEALLQYCAQVLHDASKRTKDQKAKDTIEDNLNALAEIEKDAKARLAAKAEAEAHAIADEILKDPSEPA